MPRTRECDAVVRAGRLRKADGFLIAADIVRELGDDQLNDAVVTNCVHAGIAAADVICCASLGVYAIGDSHAEAVALLRKVDGQLANRLKVLLGMKSASGYSHIPASAGDVLRAQRAAEPLVEAARLAHTG